MTTRIITGAGLVLLLGFGIWMGGWVFAALFLFFVYSSMFEMYRALKNAGHRIVEWPAWICALLMPFMFRWFSSVTMFLPLVVGACMLTAFAVMFRKDPKLEDLLTSVLPLLCVLLPGMCMLGLQNAAERLHEVMLILLSFGIPLMGDTMAYFIGSRFGKHPFCPAISPHKTTEGAAAGLLGSILFALVVYCVFSFLTSIPPLWHFLVLGLLGGCAGQGGDLFASFIKRHCGVKDYGTVFPGHGGFMDRMDSSYWAVVIVYLYLNLHILPIR